MSGAGLAHGNFVEGADATLDAPTTLEPGRAIQIVLAGRDALPGPTVAVVVARARIVVVAGGLAPTVIRTAVIRGALGVQPACGFADARPEVAVAMSPADGVVFAWCVAPLRVEVAPPPLADAFALDVEVVSARTVATPQDDVAELVRSLADDLTVAVAHHLSDAVAVVVAVARDAATRAESLVADHAPVPGPTILCMDLAAHHAVGRAEHVHYAVRAPGTGGPFEVGITSFDDARAIRPR
jgi:hypothetical protein